ncbi:MAG: hypothetical protein MUD12_11225 [Spirochaetes bacterium]|jgi:hypothetical protein|nr:hypothetical protein [Spirochaetota bacterium]
MPATEKIIQTVKKYLIKPLSGRDAAHYRFLIPGDKSHAQLKPLEFFFFLSYFPGIQERAENICIEKIGLCALYV